MEDGESLGKTRNGDKDVEKQSFDMISTIDEDQDDDNNRYTKLEKEDDVRSMSPSLEGSIEPVSDAVLQEDLRARSRSSSVRSRAVTIIPRLKRRGLLGQLAIIPEVTRPKEYTRKTKWLITLTVAIAAAAAPMGSAVFFPSLPELAAHFHASNTVTNLSVALYMLSMSIFPLWWSSFSETLGRRTIYLLSFTLFTIFSILSAVSTSIGMLIAMRMLGGGAAASVQAVGAGTIADIWESKERGKAMSIFYLGPLMGPLIAPIVGGALAQEFGWRSTQWFLAIYGGLLLLVLTFCLPETLIVTVPAVETLPTNREVAKEGAMHAVTRVSTRQSVKINTFKFGRLMKRFFIDPAMIVTYLRFPAVALTVYYAAITFGSLYILNVSVQQTFSRAPYNFTTLLVGLLYIPNSLGYILGSLVGGRWSDTIMAREAKAANRLDPDGKLVYIPEDRMRENAYVAAAMYPLGLVLYGWAAHYGLHWMVAATANFFFGVGSMIIFACSTTMLTEFMPKKSSSGVALNNFVRNIFSCVGGIVASPLLDRIGNGWLFTGLGVWALASGGVVWALRRFGPKWREEMNKQLV